MGDHLDRSPVLYSLRSQAGVVDINHAFHLYNKGCMWVVFQSISTWLRGFSPGIFSSLLKMYSQSNPSGSGAVLRGHTWVVFRGRASSRLHSSFDPTSLSCARRNSVSDYEEGRLTGQILIAITGRSGRGQKCASKNFDPRVQTTLNSSRKIS